MTTLNRPFLFRSLAALNNTRPVFFLLVVSSLLAACVRPSIHEAVQMDLSQARTQLAQERESNHALNSRLEARNLENQALRDELSELHKRDQLHVQDKERLAQKNIELSSEVAQLNRLVAALSETTQFQDARLENLMQDLLREAEARKKEQSIKLELLREVEDRRTEMARLKSTHDRLVGELQEEIREGEIKITQALDRLSVNLVERILFDSGSAHIKPKGLEILNRVGNILAKLTDKQIQIQGHTDNVPIGGQLKEIYPSNWELSAARAITVVRHLSEKLGIHTRFLSAVGRGDSEPVASNDTPEGRAQNRRIEIILSPLEFTEILDDLKSPEENPESGHAP